MTDDIGLRLHDAVADVHAEPGLAQKVIKRSRRRRNRIVAIGAVVVLGAAGSATGVALTHNVGNDNTATISAVTAPPSATPPDLLAGPQPPKNATRLLGRAYPIDTTTVNGLPATEVIYWADVKDRPGSPTNNPSLCTAKWTPGTSLSTAIPDRCEGPIRAFHTADHHDILISWEDGSFSNAFPNVTAMILAENVGRVQLLVALHSDLAATASTDGGHPPVRKTQDVTLLGADETDAPFLIGTAPNPPAGYVYVGENIWDTNGKLIMHELSGWYCGPDPKSGKTTYECPK